MSPRTPTQTKPDTKSQEPNAPAEAGGASEEENTALAPWENMPEVTDYVSAPVVIPDQIKALVDKYHNAHVERDNWFQLPFEDDKSASDVLRLAKKYAESLEPARTVRRKSHPDKSVLVFRVIDKKAPATVTMERVAQETAPEATPETATEKDGK